MHAVEEENLKKSELETELLNIFFLNSVSKNNIKPGFGYVPIPNELIRYSKYIGSTELKVLLFLILIRNEFEIHTTRRPSTIADFVGLSEKHTRRILKRLEKIGLVTYKLHGITKFYCIKHTDLSYKEIVNSLNLQIENDSETIFFPGVRYLVNKEKNTQHERKYGKADKPYQVYWDNYTELDAFFLGHSMPDKKEEETRIIKVSSFFIGCSPEKLSIILYFSYCNGFSGEYIKMDKIGSKKLPRISKSIEAIENTLGISHTTIIKILKEMEIEGIIHSRPSKRLTYRYLLHKCGFDKSFIKEKYVEKIECLFPDDPIPEMESLLSPNLESAYNNKPIIPLIKHINSEEEQKNTPKKENTNITPQKINQKKPSEEEKPVRISRWRRINMARELERILRKDNIPKKQEEKPVKKQSEQEALMDLMKAMNNPDLMLDQDILKYTGAS